MTIKLEFMEIVWLQNVKRNPGKYHPFTNSFMKHLVDACLIAPDRIYGKTYITELGTEVLKRHLPYTVPRFELNDDQLQLWN